MDFGVQNFFFKMEEKLQCLYLIKQIQWRGEINNTETGQLQGVKSP